MTMLSSSREELVAKLRHVYDVQDADKHEQTEVAGRALDDEIAKSDFTINELSEEAYFIKDDKKKS